MLQLPEPGKIIVAIDEAGRGCLAFEVVAAAVVFPPNIDMDSDEISKNLANIKDSKKLSAKKRDSLSEFIKKFALAYGIGVSTPEEIDRVNILQATYNAMHRALDQVVEKLGTRYAIDHIMVDGDRFKPYIAQNGVNWIQHTCVPSGDDIHMNIAAASILAKTHRDHMVDAYVEEDPTLQEKYGFDKNKAYGTVKHIDGLKKYGATQFHRKSFAPVRLYA
jgi:ribonuclease HII